jgi:hypothetical protein
MAARAPVSLELSNVELHRSAAGGVSSVAAAQHPQHPAMAKHPSAALAPRDPVSFPVPWLRVRWRRGALAYLAQKKFSLVLGPKAFPYYKGFPRPLSDLKDLESAFGPNGPKNCHFQAHRVHRGFGMIQLRALAPSPGFAVVGLQNSPLGRVDSSWPS